MQSEASGAIGKLIRSVMWRRCRDRHARHVMIGPIKAEIKTPPLLQSASRRGSGVGTISASRSIVPSRCGTGVSRGKRMSRCSRISIHTQGYTHGSGRSRGRDGVESRETGRDLGGSGIREREHRCSRISLSFSLSFSFLSLLFFPDYEESLNAHCTINTSDTELMLRTYMVTPTSTGGPAINKTIRPWSL